MKGKMNMKKLWVLIVLVIFFVGSYGTYLLLMFAKGTPTQTTTVTTSPELKDKILIFHSENCPHCKQLIADFTTKKVEDTVKNIKWLTVDEGEKNKYNVNLYISKAVECELGQENYVIPLAYHEGKCYIGGDKISEYVYGFMDSTSTTSTTK